MMFKSVLLLGLMSTVVRAAVEYRGNPAHWTGSLMEHLMRVTHNFDLKCFREIQLKGAPSVVGYLSCGKKNTLSFTSSESGMIRNIYISKAKRLTCGQPSCSIEASGQKKRSWDGTGLCVRSNKMNLLSGRKISYISSSSHYSKIIYGIEDQMDYDYRILTFEMDSTGGSCEHVVHSFLKQSNRYHITVHRTTCGLAVGPCNKGEADKCIFVCICGSYGHRVCQTTAFKEPEFHQGNLTAYYHHYKIFEGSDSILSISMDSNHTLYVLTSTGHQMLVNMYVKQNWKWQFMKSYPMDSEAVSFVISNINSNMLITKNSIKIVSFSKTIFKNETDLVCWCNDGNTIAIVNKLYPFERKLTLM